MRLASWRSPSAVRRFTRPISLRYIRTVSEVPPLESVRSVLGGRGVRARSTRQRGRGSRRRDGRDHVGHGLGRRALVDEGDDGAVAVWLSASSNRVDEADALARERVLHHLDDLVGQLDVFQHVHDLVGVDRAPGPARGE